MFSHVNKKCGISPLYCLLIYQTPKWQIYTSVIAPLLGPGGYPAVLWGALVFHVHLMWTREKHISLLATMPPLPSLLITPELLLVVQWEKKREKSWQTRCKKCSVAFLVTRSDRKSVFFIEVSRTSESWALILHRGWWNELICQDGTMF